MTNLPTNRETHLVIGRFNNGRLYPNNNPVTAYDLREGDVIERDGSKYRVYLDGRSNHLREWKLDSVIASLPRKNNYLVVGYMDMEEKELEVYTRQKVRRNLWPGEVVMLDIFPWKTPEPWVYLGDNEVIDCPEYTRATRPNLYAGY
jgi:hypothetical protein